MNARTTKQRSRWWAMLAGGVLLVGVGVYAGRNLGTSAPANGSGSPAALSRAPDRHVTDAQRLAVLEKQIRRLQADARQQRLQDVERDEQRQLGAADTADVPEHADPQEAARRAEAARLKFVDGLEQRVRTEPVDTAWRNETEPVIEQLLPERMGAGIAVDDVRCASSICRARIEHSDSARIPAEKLTAFLDKRGPLSSLELQFDTREDGVTTLYLLRPQEAGQEL